MSNHLSRSGLQLLMRRATKKRGQILISRPPIPVSHIINYAWAEARKEQAAVEARVNAALAGAQEAARRASALANMEWHGVFAGHTQAENEAAVQRLMTAVRETPPRPWWKFW